MMKRFAWIFFLILQHALVMPWPLENQPDVSTINIQRTPPSNNYQSEQVVSVRITSSVAVDRGNGKSNPNIVQTHQGEPPAIINRTTNLPALDIVPNQTNATPIHPLNINNLSYRRDINFGFKNQLETKDSRKADVLGEENSLKTRVIDENTNSTIDSAAESSDRSEIKYGENLGTGKVEELVPLALSIPTSYSSNKLDQDVKLKQYTNNKNSSRLTTVSFNIVHNSPEIGNYDQVRRQSYPNLQQFYNNLPKVYSEPAKVYSEPAKFYSEPAKVYSEPAKVYSEPAKIYSEPAKFYSEPASLHLPWNHQPKSTRINNYMITTTPLITLKTPEHSFTTPPNYDEHQPEKNYEVDEKISVQTDGKAHGVQTTNGENCQQENCKVGYVVEGSQYRKYRVEERTSDGYLVGEYGVVRNEDGALRGVRYTADSEASPRLIQDALMKFLQLK